MLLPPIQFKFSNLFSSLSAPRPKVPENKNKEGRYLQDDLQYLTAHCDYKPALATIPEEEPPAAPAPKKPGLWESVVNRYQTRKQHRHLAQVSRQLEEEAERMQQTASRMNGRSIKSPNFEHVIQKLRFKIFGTPLPPEVSPVQPRVVRGSLKTTHTETLGHIPTLTRHAKIKLLDGDCYELTTEEIRASENQKSLIPTFRPGSLIRLELSGKHPEKLTYRVWPNPHVLHEKISYLSPKWLRFEREYITLRRNFSHHQKQPQDALLKVTLFNRLHSLLKDIS